MIISIYVTHNTPAYIQLLTYSALSETKTPPSHATTHTLDVMLNMLSDASLRGAAGPSGHFMLINAVPPSAELLD